MKNLCTILSLILILFFNSCSGGGDDPIPPGPPANLTTTQDLIDHFTGEKRGTSTLTRIAGQISFEIETTNLIPGHVYQIICSVYNHPENCAGSCDETDFESDGVEGIAFVMAGKAVNSSSAKFEGTLKKNDITTYDWVPPTATAGWGGLQDPMTAQIFLDVKSQGPYQSDKSDAQLYTWKSACSYKDWAYSDPESRVPEEIGECAFIQTSNHIAPSN